MSIRQQLKNLSIKRSRPFDEILRYYAMERFLYRLSISPYTNRFFLKGGLMLKVWNPQDHRATMDIDLLEKVSNKRENLKQIIHEVSQIQGSQDAILFNSQKLNLDTLKRAISKVFSHRNTRLEYPISFSQRFYDAPDTMKRWQNFLSLLGKEHTPFQEVIAQIAKFIHPLIETQR